jgi:heme-degrading monooxygenase HmoA
MKKITGILVAVAATATTLIVQSAALADVVRISTSVFKDLGPIQKSRAENLRLHKAAPGLVSVFFYTDSAKKEGGAVSVWKTKEQAEAFYASEAYKKFAEQNITPQVVERRAAIYEIDPQ